jgi:hypothetical protein
MPILRPALAAVSLVLALAGRLTAQAVPGASSRPEADTTDVLVLDHDFSTGGAEVVHVFLESRQVYRGELSSPDVTLQVRALGGKTKAPRIYALLGSDSPSGASIVEVYPDVDGEYEIRPVTGTGSGVSTRLRLFRDIRASHRRTAILDQPGWEIGMELAASWHSGFAQSNGPLPVSARDPHTGSDVEVCFAARSAPGVPRFSMCVLGLGYQSQTGAPSILWIYTEPRVRILGKARRGRSNWEMGALFRFGAGSINRSSTVPVIFAPGAYVARHIRTGASGSGWSIMASYAHPTYKGFPTPLGNTDAVPPHNDRLTLGLGWYQ